MKQPDRQLALSSLSITLVVLLLLAFSFSDVYASPRLPSAKRECALCHIMWLTEFKREDVKPLVPYEPKPVVKSGRQDVSSTERMCLSCHDGFVLESRYLWKQNEHSHPVGKKPSKDIKIPMVDGKNLFPLNDDGNVYCGTCHTAHGTDWEAKDSPVFMRVNSRDGELCEACHKQKTTGPKKGNHPIKEKAEVVPGFLKTTRAKLSNDKNVTCQSCHTAHGAATEKKLLVTNNRNSQLCSNCHEDLHSWSLEQAAVKRSHPVNIVPQQAKIPEFLAEHGSIQGDKGQLICQTCHTVHDSKTDHGILVKDNKDSALCLSCHKKQQQVTDSKHDINLIKKKINTAGCEADDKNPCEINDEVDLCSSCHLPHKGKGPKMWAREIPEDTEPMAAICLSCHQESGLAEKHLVGEHSHPVGFAVREGVENVNLPTFSKYGVKFNDAGRGWVTCASCHDAHQWAPGQKNIETPGKNTPLASFDIEGDASNSFLRMQNDQDSSLCRNCHKQKLTIIGSEHDLTETAPDSLNALKQSPEKAGICGSCHHIHNGLGPRMWARKPPAGVLPAAANCLSCHNADGIAKEKSIDQHSHPVGVDVTKLGIKVELDKWLSDIPELLGLNEPIALPLYDEHGRSLTGGHEVGCGTCHDPHRWSAETNVAETDIEGDASSSFLRIAEQGNSELCVNCHAEKSVINNSKHGDEDLALGDDSAQGPCSACHRPHDTKGPYLWAREMGDGKMPIEKLCTSCHSKHGVADGKLTGDYSHPLNIKLTDAMQGTYLPLFDINNGKKNEKGRIDCATCHDTHQWNPHDIQNITDASDDGDASTSFLRISASDNSELCTECHSEQQAVLETEHNMSVAKIKNKSGQSSVNASGVCGQCHIPHNAKTAFRLWAHDASNGNNRNAQLCLSCHRKDGIAQNKVPPQTQHPENANVWSGALRSALRPGSHSTLPVFGHDGEQSKIGVISCPSCHNPHQWQAETSRPGPGKNIEGDIQNSFLRITDSRSFVCADCHGQDSIFRYKYFHSETSHRKHGMFR